GMGIAFHARPLVRQSASHSVSHLGLDALLYLIGVRDRDLDNTQFRSSAADAYRLFRDPDRNSGRKRLVVAGPIRKVWVSKLMQEIARQYAADGYGEDAIPGAVNKVTHIEVF